MSDVPAKYETTYYEVIQREMADAERLVDLAMSEQWPRAEVERIRDKILGLFHHLTDYLSDLESLKPEPDPPIIKS